MLISLNWLKEFVDIPNKVTPRQLGEDLTLRAFEVEEVVDQAVSFDKMVVGRVDKIQAHPDADKLKICVTNIGEKLPAQIICGGKNIYEGMKAVVALPGSKVKWHGDGELVEMKKTKIRGVESQGMICASAEIGLAESTDAQPEGSEGVMDLKVDVHPGTPLAEALELNDVIIDVDNKSLTNRADLWGHRGIAREIAAIYSGELKVKSYKLTVEETLRQAQGDNALSVKIEDAKLCPRYVAVKVDNVKVEPSPQWLQSRLIAVGQRPINNLVDISNYVMFELGQPIHIFDMDKLKDQSSKIKITVKNAEEGETVKTLDGEDRKLTKNDLIIANEKGFVAIAGIIGGGNSEVEEKTNSIVIEAANFDPISVRLTAARLGLRTEASVRFEKGLDPHLPEEAVALAYELINKLYPEAQVTAYSDEGEWLSEEKKLEVDVNFINQKLGVELKEDEIVKILESLGFKVSNVNGPASAEASAGRQLSIVVPTWRGDISIPEDIVEEVGRIYGYDKIPSALPPINPAGAQSNVDLEFERKVRNYLTLGAGFQEIENVVFENVKNAKVLGFDLAKYVEIENPLAEGQGYLRYSLMPNLLSNVKDNLRFRESFKIFEIGRVFKNKPSEEYKVSQEDKEALPDQPKRLAGVIVGDSVDIFGQTKGAIENLLDSLGVDYELLLEQDHDWIQAGTEMRFKVGKRYLGELGLMNNQMLKRMKIEKQVGVFIVDYDFLMELKKREVKYKPLPEFPAVTRDLAIEVDASIKYSDLEQAIKKSGQLLDSVELFDVYEGEQIGAGKRSLAWHLSFRDPKKTLTSEEADKELGGIIKALEKKFGAKVRA